MAPKKPAQEPSPPSRPPEANGAPAKPAAAPATRVLPQRQGLHSPRTSSAGQSSASFRPGTSDSQQRRGPEKSAAPPPEPETTLIAEQALQQQPVQPQPQQQQPQQPAQSQPGSSQPASPRPTRPRSSASAPVSPIQRPTSGTKRLTRSDAEEAKVAAERKAEEDKVAAESKAEEDRELAEEQLLEEAAAIRRLRDSLARPAPPAIEPKRPKTHWDHLLEEMAWLAKEFQKERKWKLNMAKKYVRAVARSNLDLESRKNVRQKEAELAIRRKAAFIGKEVMQFWKKAERVMVYKRQSQLDARKKQAMDKHLSFLVDQTQKYSSLLAQRLGTSGEEVLALPPPQTTPKPAQSEAQPSAPSPSQPALVKAEDAALDKDGPILALANEADVDVAERDGSAVEPAQAQGMQAGTHVAIPALADDMEVSEESEADSPHAAQHGSFSRRARSGLAALGQDQQAGEDDADEFRANSGSEEEDDEATLEEEEALARNAGEDSGNEDELAALNDEADMPLEQLMALYGYIAGGAEAEPKQEPAAPEDPAGPSSRSHAEPKQAGGQPPVKGEPEPEEHITTAMHEDSQEDEDEQEDAEEKQAKGLADLMGKAEEGEEGGLDDDYACAGSEADDEATLEEEDALAAQDGLDQKEQDDAEVAALANEADMPLEQLLEMYGMVIDENAQPAQQSSKGAAQADSALPAAEEPSESRPCASKRRRLAVGAEATDVKQAGQQAALDAAAQQAASAATKAAIALATPGVAAPAEVPGGSSEGAARAVPTAEEDADAALAELEKVSDGKAKLEGVARLAEAAQPKGSTLDSAGVYTPVPFLLKGSLREYQHVGLDWLVTMYTRRLNGILADEMGLGKTIMTIALLAHLACEKGVWGPHLIVVPTSVMLNWEVECKKWCPAFKLLTYYGSAKERKAKRQGWSKPNAFHICITSYTLVLQDAKMFRRKKWKYLILDEAHMIKNWKSQRWQTLLNFNSQRRLLITGTPLQNDLMELWSLMHFLMPQVFASHAQFKDWFSNPLTGMVEGQEAVNKALVERLHSVLRPFLLRRLKRDVEKSLPGKHEHIIRCRLSKRQRTLYEDYMAASDVRNTLSSGNFLGIINVLMQLRKVCNHPDLFEGRAIISAFDMLPSISIQEPSAVLTLRQLDPASSIDLASMGPSALHCMSAWEAAETQDLQTPGHLIQELPPASAGQAVHKPFAASLPFVPSVTAQALVQRSVAALQDRRWAAAADRRRLMAAVNARRCALRPMYGMDLLRAVHVDLPVHHVNIIKEKRGCLMDFSQALADAVKTAAKRAEEMEDTLRTFMFVIPKARAVPPEIWCSRPDASAAAEQQAAAAAMQQEWFQRSAPLRTAIVRQQVFFPDRRLIQFDCGKLQELAILLRRLKSGGHKALIFTQMARMLDVLEVFLNLHGYTYLRLDGTTKPEQRQILMQRYNTNPKLFIFILSTRSGGVGMNLTGADTVIFYDSDWNPAMDAQAQDRCHRIGQTREVHIYRLVSESTIEENILHKSDQKRQLDHLAIQSGGFNTDFLQKFNPRELLGIQAAAPAGAPVAGGALSAEEMQAAMQSVEDETDQAAAQALALETEAELAEFNADPVLKPVDPEGDEDDADAEETRDPEASGLAERPSASVPASQPSAELPALKAEEDDADMMDDVAALAGHGKSGDALATLESALSPVERYAVHFLEEQAAINAEVEAAAAAVEAELDAQEWNMQEIERIQEEQEAEIEEDVEATRVLDWDKAAADAAYRAKVEEAEARQRALLEQQAAAEAAWLEQQEALLAAQAAMPVAPVYTRKPAKKARTPELDDAESQQYSPYPRFSRKRARTARGRMVVRPRWPGEDTTPSASRDDASDTAAYSSADEASQPWPGGRAKRQHSLLSPQSARQRSRMCNSSQGGTLIKQEVSDTYTPGQPGVSGSADIPRPYNSSRQYPQIGHLRAPAHVWLPWEVLEDVVLATMVEEAPGPQLSSSSMQITQAVWQLISDALAAGAATLSMPGATAASQPVKLRSPQQCRERYEMLLTALQDSSAQTPSVATLGARPTLLAAPLPSATSAPIAIAGLPASSLGESVSLAPGVEAGSPPHSQAVPSSSPSATAAHAVLAPAKQASTPGLTAQQGTAPAHPSSAPALRPASSPHQSSPGQQPDGSQQSMVHEHGSMVGSAGSVAPSKHELQPTSTNGAVWDLASELQTLREHLAWLAKSNVVCGVEGIRAVVATAMGGHTLADRGPAAAQLAEVLAELQSLPMNGHLEQLVGRTGPKALHRSRVGAPLQPQPLQVTRADAAKVKAAVISAGGVSSRGVLRHLAAVVSAVRSGGVKEGHAALRQLLQPPGQPASLAPPLPQAQQQYPQQQLRPPAMHSLAPGPPGARPMGVPAPGQAYSQTAPGMHASYAAQRPYAPGFQQQGVRSGVPGASTQMHVRPGGLQQYQQGSHAQASRPLYQMRPQLPQQAGLLPGVGPGVAAQQPLPAYLRPAIMQQVQQVVGQMQTGAGGASGQPQSNMHLLPGLQALLGQQASSMAGSLPGQATNPQSQQYNLALLHSLLAQAHSAGGTAAAAHRPYSAGQMLGTSQGTGPTGQPQAPILGLGMPGQQGLPAMSSGQGAEQPLQQSAAPAGISAAGAAKRDMHSQAPVVSAAQQGLQERQTSATDQANAPR